MATKTAEKMATKAETRQATQLPVTQGTNSVGASRAERMAADAGKGVSQDRDDKIIPMVRVLQAQSPQCLKAKPEFIKGAEAGDFFLKNTLEPLVKGEEGFIFQPCYFTKAWLQFDGPRDDNPKFVKRHDDLKGRPAGVDGLDLAEDGYDFTNKDGHRFTLSREFYGLVNSTQPFLFPFGGSGHTTAREWQTLMDQFQLKNGQPEPSFNRKYKITTVPKSNESGDWYGVRFAPVGEVTDEEYDRGLALHNAVAKGAVRGEAPESEVVPAGKAGDEKI